MNFEHLVNKQVFMKTNGFSKSSDAKKFSFFFLPLPRLSPFLYFCYSTGAYLTPLGMLYIECLTSKIFAEPKCLTKNFAQKMKKMSLIVAIR